MKKIRKVRKVIKKVKKVVSLTKCVPEHLCFREKEIKKWGRDKHFKSRQTNKENVAQVDLN